MSRFRGGLNAAGQPSRTPRGTTRAWSRPPAGPLARHTHWLVRGAQLHEHRVLSWRTSMCRAAGGCEGVVHTASSAQTHASHGIRARNRGQMESSKVMPTRLSPSPSQRPPCKRSRVDRDTSQRPRKTNVSAAASEAISAAHVLQALLHKLPRTPAAYERYLVKAITCDHPFLVKDLTWWTTMLAGSYLHKFSELTASGTVLTQVSGCPLGKATSVDTVSP